MDSDKDCDFVNVAIRIKLSKTKTDRSAVEAASTNPTILLVPEKQLTYTFDHIFEQDVGQQQIYEDLVKPLVNKVFLGYNSTIFAYGQTGTGKTFTIGSNPLDNRAEDAGLITRALEDVLSMRNDNNIEILVSFVEIYNEKVYDLLGASKSALQVKGFNVAGMTKHSVSNSGDAADFLINGGRNRHTGETKQNSKSSRSHAIFTIYCKVEHSNHNTDAKLHLVDLAGSESIKRTGNEGNLLHEGININKGLLSIGRVINALSSNDPHVPYRESTITTILQDSLNKKNFVTLIACISNSSEDITETVQTLDFSQSAKRFRSRPELNCNATSSRHNVCTPAKYNRWCISSTPLPTCSQFPPAFTMLKNGLHRNLRRNLGKSDATANSVHKSQLAKEIPSTLSPIIRACINQTENRFLSHLTSIFASSRPANPCISRHSLQREITKIVAKNMTVEPRLQTFRKKLNTSGNSSTYRFDGDLGDAEASSPINCHLDGKHASPILGRHEFIVPEVPTRRRSNRNIQPRRSIRLANINKSAITKKGTPKKERKRQRLAKQLTHDKMILELLNNGSIIQLTKLQTIGPKSAAMIYDFRQLHGKFKSISDLRRMPWRGKGFERFTKGNFLDISST